MSVAGLVDIPLDVFGGYVSPDEFDPQNLPSGAAWDAQDVQFPETGVRTRPGLTTIYSEGTNRQINYTKTYTDLRGNNRALFLDSLGGLQQEYPQGIFTSLGLPGMDFVSTNLHCHSATLFGYEYLAIHDGKFGSNIPRQWNGINTYIGPYLDRVTQVGPAVDPVCADLTPTVKNIVAAPNGASEVNNIVTVVTTVAHGFVVGDTVTIAGVAVAGYNVVATITSVPSTTTFTYVCPTTGLAASGNGTATPVGNVAAGVRKVAVIFVTRNGARFISPGVASYTAAGGNQASISAILTGPPNVVARIVCFTAANGGNFFFIPDRMTINDNSTGTLVVDFTDAALTASTNVDQLFNQVELGECAGVIEYANRLFWWGERNHMNNWTNLSFDGYDSSPLGWTVDPTFGAGGVVQPQQYAVYGEVYNIQGNNITATRGLIYQNAAVDVYGQPRIRYATSYSVRARINQSGLTQGTLHINLKSASAGFTTPGLAVTFAQAGAIFKEFTAELISNIQILAGPVPSDLLLQVYADGTPNFGGVVSGFFVDCIEIYPTNQPYNSSLVRASRASQPENYDGVTGIMSVAENNGQRITSMYKIREQLYIAKERSLYVTQDDGVNEPNQWPITEISNKVGSVSVEGTAVGEEWATLAAREGFYITGGGEPAKLCKEIQPDWDKINWQYGHTIWTKIDTRRRLILVGVPIGSATSPNKIFALSYRALDSWEDIAAHPMVHFSSYSGKILSIGNARKWCPWNISANSCGLIERNDGTAQIFLGNGAGNGKLYQLDDNATSDDGVAINSYYTPYFFPSHQEEQGLQLGSHRKLFGYLAFQASGLGNLTLTARTAADIANLGALSLPFPVATIVGGAGGASQTFFTVTITTVAPHGFSAGQRVTVSGVTVAGYNTTAQIIATPTPTTFTYDLLVSGLAASGGGTAQVILTPSAFLLGSEVLSLAPQWDAERTINISGERVSFKVGTNAVGHWFWLKKFIVSVKRHPTSPVRGAN